LYDLWSGFPGVLRIVEPFNPILEVDHANLKAQPLSFFSGNERHILLFTISCQIPQTINGLDILIVR